MADYSNNKFEITILTSQIFKLKPFEDIELDINDVREMRKVYLTFSNGHPFAVLLDASNNFTPTEEARILLASKEYTEKRIAAAFVTRSLVNKLFGNFFIQFNRPATPTLLFNNETDAYEWLVNQVKKYNEKTSISDSDH